MSFIPPSPSQEFMPAQDSGQLQTMTAQEDSQVLHESSEDEEPLMARRYTRDAAKEREGGMTLRDRRTLRDTGRQDTDEHSRERPIHRQHAKSSLKSVSKQKKPGPRAWAAKPIMKNDMKAKREVIREIQSYWGKGFIKACIPKCHRPLVKRGNSNKRSSYREHETDPKNWLPSVLKAILMIAKLTDDKKWLAQAMNDVVRYRIKHTGNRKPQLVTTDFDVIEDMLVKEWSVEYSFGIRYKHLLVNRKDQEEDDETIDNILEAGSDHDPSASDLEDSDSDDQSVEDDEGDEVDVSQGRGSNPGKYLHGYPKASRYPSPASLRHQSKQPNMRGDTPLKRGHPQQVPSHQQQGMYGYGGPMSGYGPPMDAWGRPMPAYGGPDGYNNGYGGYGSGFGGSTGYAPPQFSRDARQGTQPPRTHGMQSYLPPHHAMTPAPNMPGSDYGIHSNNPNKRGRDSPSSANKRARDAYDQPPGFDTQGYAQPYDGGRTKIKRESPAEDFDNPDNDLGEQEDDEDNKAAVDADIEAMELELKLAKMKAARLRKKR
jgi:hypothetical protein